MNVYDQRNVKTSQCEHTTDGEHHCVHDWRIYWGNVDRQATE